MSYYTKRQLITIDTDILRSTTTKLNDSRHLATYNGTSTLISDADFKLLDRYRAVYFVVKDRGTIMDINPIDMPGYEISVPRNIISNYSCRTPGDGREFDPQFNDAVGCTVNIRLYSEYEYLIDNIVTPCMYTKTIFFNHTRESIENGIATRYPTRRLSIDISSSDLDELCHDKMIDEPLIISEIDFPFVTVEGKYSLKLPYFMFELINNDNNMNDNCYLKTDSSACQAYGITADSDRHIRCELKSDGCMYIGDSSYITNILSNRDDEKKSEDSHNKTDNMNSLVNKFKEMYMPVEVSGVAYTIDGNIAIKTSDGYKGFKSGVLTSYPEQMCIKLPVYKVRKPISDVKVGDDVIMSDEVIRVNKNDGKKLYGVSYDGTSRSKVGEKDAIIDTDQPFVYVIYKMNFGDGGKIDPMMFMLMDKGGDMKDILMIQMMQSGKIDPMMFMLMDKDCDMKDIFLVQMMQNNGGNIDPMMFAPVMYKGKDDMKDILMIQMMQSGKIDPMMLMLMDKDCDMKDVLMVQMMKNNQKSE